MMKLPFCVPALLIYSFYPNAMHRLHPMEVQCSKNSGSQSDHDNAGRQGL